MKCVYCGQEHDPSIQCEYFQSATDKSLDNICLVLRDILEELKKMNELTEGK